MIAGVGHNNPPADTLEDLASDNDIDIRNLMIADRALHCICYVCNKVDPLMAQVKRAGGDYYSVRNLWLWAMSPHIPNNQLARISRLNRKTVTSYVQQVEKHKERNGLLGGFCDMIADMVEPLPGIVDDASEALADFAVEAAIDRMRKAVDGLGR